MKQLALSFSRRQTIEHDQLSNMGANEKKNQKLDSPVSKSMLDTHIYKYYKFNANSTIQ